MNKRVAVAAAGFLLLIPIAGGVSVGFTGADPAPAQSTHQATTPDAIKWAPFAPGIQVAAISGSPVQEGAPFVIRLKLADGARIPPHWHPTDEHVTVLSGTFFAGMGEKFDTSAGHALPAGSYALMPKEMRHFAWAKGETIVQVHGIGPFKIIWVNPADDPTKKPN